ncbi:Putative protein of unknown function [Podospora comata]|uniref:CorA-like transporter domain-containing protein n=1 Tax=Podospora comata TaxID=48703 RepID=A0ABY6RZT7_PODCO|nr:Putative protein of unknown function [Podospora comata]
MAKLLFTFRQVDPSFLAFVYNFYCGYGCQNADLSLSQFAPTLGISPQPNYFSNRSGNAICHSLILRGIGQDIDRLQAGRTDSWARQQVVTYHSFDIKPGTATWKTRKATKSYGRCFEGTLGTHLIYFNWSAWNWRGLANEIERRLHGTLQVLDVITSQPYDPGMQKSSGCQGSRVLARLSGRPSPYSLVIDRINLNGQEDDDRAARYFFFGSFKNQDVLGVIDHGLTPLLQRLQRLDQDLELNVDTVNSVRQRYEGLETGQDPDEELKITAKPAIDGFLSRVRLIIASFENRRKHLLSLCRQGSRRRGLLYAILVHLLCVCFLDADIMLVHSTRALRGFKLLNPT